MRRIATLFTTLALAVSGLVFSPVNAAVPTDGTYNCNTGIATTATPNYTITAGVVSYGSACVGAVVIPDGVTEIGNFAFQDATSLTSITIPASVTSVAPDIFYGSTSLAAITFLGAIDAGSPGNGTVNLPILSRTGSTFNGWYSDASLMTRIGNGGTQYRVVAPSTLYAKFISYAARSHWAISATATESYPGYGPESATGVPNATGCDGGAEVWASEAANSKASITLTYAEAILPRQINVYQNNTKDAVSRIEISRNGNAWTSVYIGDPAMASLGTCLPDNSFDDILAVPISSHFRTPIKYIRVTVDQFHLSDWAEIDAVQLIGKATQTVPAVSASLKVRKTLTLPAKTNRSLKVTWISSTKKVCKVTKGKVKGIKKGICKITGTNPGNANYLAFSIQKSIIIK